jgi:hypothetical protein
MTVFTGRKNRLSPAAKKDTVKAVGQNKCCKHPDPDAIIVKQSKTLAVHAPASWLLLEKPLPAHATQKMRLHLMIFLPDEVLRKKAEFTFDHHRRSQDFIRLVMVATVHEGRQMLASDEKPGQNASTICLLEEMSACGLAAGMFRSFLTGVEQHWHISARRAINLDGPLSEGL